MKNIEPYYPKVLILGHFNQHKPVGITINNLYNHWPKNKIAVASFSNLKEMYSPICKYYYCLGNLEIKYFFPFNLFYKISPSYFLEVNSNFNSIHYNNASKKVKDLYKPFFKTILHTIVNYFFLKTGLSLIKHKYIISQQFINWIKTFDPDIIYVTVEDLSRIKFILELKNTLGIKLVTHIMDDWINSVYIYTIFPKYWKKKLSKYFKTLIEVSDLNFVISEKMAEEYHKIYKKTFFVFHNPINISMWDNIMRKNNNSNTFLLIYAGKINKDTIIPIIDVIDVIKYNKFKYKIDFRIYTTSSYIILHKYLGERTNTYYFGSIEYSNIPKILKNADGLLLPLSFSQKSIKYTRLSMPTKVTEYMISGTPILLYAPKNIAVSEYLNKYNCAIVANNKKELKHKLKYLIDNYNNIKIKTMVINAYNRVKQYHEMSTVNTNLRNALSQILNH